ncbi:MAG: DUF2997 domain-containing protein [Myxococcota bacterium]|jgi:hypothetical protein|nr:DUF2997 domain-containing protein [Myxococcota bacterium]
MDPGELLITIDAAGRVQVEVRGVAGARCLAFADLVQEILGGEQSRELTAEYHAAAGQLVEQVTQHARRRGWPGE